MKFEKRVLNNGLTILFEKRDVDVTTVMLGAKYGSSYEKVEEKGISHFIEHLCFKGTKGRGVKEIASSVESVGGDLNAFTHEEATVYYVKLPSNHLEIAMDVIFDIFFNPSFPDSDVKKEAGVICEEIKMYKDNPMQHTIEKIKGNLYGDPFGMCILGLPEVVCKMTREQLIEKHNAVYVPENSVLCVVGNNDIGDIVSFAKRFSPDKDKRGVVFDVPKIVLRNLHSEENRDNLEQANVAIGFHFPVFGDKEYYASEVFSTILGRGMSSRLFTEVREKRGLVYNIKSDLGSGKNYSYLLIWAGTDSSNVEKVKEICLKEFHKMGEVSQKELDDAKVQVIGNRKVESEGSIETAVNLIMSEVCGKAEDYYEFEESINRVTLDEIRSLAEKTEFAFFSLGPKEKNIM